MFLLKQLNFDLGLPNLLPEWKKLFTLKDLGNDVFAGITVAFIAVPLSLAIALATGVPPGVGLITAIIAGMICAIFGGSSLSVSGPAAAMSVLLADNVEKFGIEGLIAMGLLAGIMQLLSGVCGIGKLGRFVPFPVIAGFTAGIGVIIIIGQLPRAFGLEPPTEPHIVDVIKHIGESLHQINGACLLLVVITVLMIRGLPKFFPKAPSILVAVLMSTLIVYFFNLKEIPLIGNIPDQLPKPRFPHFNLSLKDLFFNAFTIYLLASLETLLSASAVDKLANVQKHNPDQELIGQGLGNIAVSFFGGIPVTAVIARSATNVKAGAKTRRASIIHALGILISVYLISPWISKIPIPALAAVLFSVAFSMVNLKEFTNLWNNARWESYIYSITFFTIIFVDLIAGVQAGLFAAGLIVLFQATKTHLHISMVEKDNVLRLSISGPLTFLSTTKMHELHDIIQRAETAKTVILDLSFVTNLDSSGAGAVFDLYQYCQNQTINFYIKGLARRYEPLLEMRGGEQFIKNCYLISEHELRNKAEETPSSSRGRLIHGFQQFYIERQTNDKRLFDYIAEQQNPHTLFITCSDSRIIPSLMTSADPGELFIIRNIGNVVPPHDAQKPYSETAGIEFALKNLDITDIVVCGHANCGAIKASRNDDVNHSFHTKHWIDLIRSQLMVNEMQLNELARINVLNQIKNLRQYPIVKQKLTEKTLNIHAWFFDFDESLVYEWDGKSDHFKPLLAENLI